MVLPVRRVPPPQHRRRGWLLLLPAALTVAVTSLLIGGLATPGPDRRPCPAHLSTSTYLAGRELRVLTEPLSGGTALIHLCSDAAIGPVGAWSVQIGTEQPAAVQRVAPSEALAAGQLVAGRQYPISVTVVPSAGSPLTFVTRIQAR